MLAKIQFFIILFFTLTKCSFSQTITAKIIDEETQKPIPYATIKYDKCKGVITNEEGDFSITTDRVITEKDSIYLSSIGYSTKAIAIQKFNDSIIFLKPEALELHSIYLTDKKLSAEEIINNVQNNLATNYTKGYSKNRFFMRESFKQYYKKLNFGFKKSSIKELTKELIDSLISSIPKRTSYYNETLGDFYLKKENNNKKLSIIKTSKLYNKNQEVSFDGLQGKFMQVLNKNVKKDSYLKIKSGLFGTKIGVDSIVNTSKNKDKIKNDYEQNHYFDSRKKNINTLVNNLFFEDESEINVIHKSSRYEFKLEDYVDFNDELVYVISFTPKRSETLKGKLYINTDDFAVMRIDYQNINPVYDKIFNMFGVNINHVRYKGSMIFGKQEDNSPYQLKYLSHENGRSFRLDRPLTIIEKNKHVKGRRKQNELKLQMQFNIVDKVKRELIVFSSNKTNGNEFNAVSENKTVDVKYFSSYNSDFWKGYTIIEPNTAIREFTTIK